MYPPEWLQIGDLTARISEVAAIGLGYDEGKGMDFRILAVYMRGVCTPLLADMESPAAADLGYEQAVKALGAVSVS